VSPPSRLRGFLDRHLRTFPFPARRNC
jgi:hypothetical protein